MAVTGQKGTAASARMAFDGLRVLRVCAAIFCHTRDGVWDSKCSRAGHVYRDRGLLEAATFLGLIRGSRWSVGYVDICVHCRLHELQHPAGWCMLAARRFSSRKEV
jgi:hypothetical protein